MSVPKEIEEIHSMRLYHFKSFLVGRAIAEVNYDPGVEEFALPYDEKDHARCGLRCYCFKEHCRRVSLWRKMRRTMLRAKWTL